MNCSAHITISCSQKECEQIQQVFLTEDKEISNARTKYHIQKENDSLVFVIEAQDAVALRAVTTAITRTLSIFEKTLQIK